MNCSSYIQVLLRLAAMGQVCVWIVADTGRARNAYRRMSRQSGPQVTPLLIEK